MKVPIMYKSSDRFNAGTDVIYDDESKLQYAPFIYASVTAKDNGGGGDEEGEDIMLVNFDLDTRAIDKTFDELKTAAVSGKVAVLSVVSSDTVSLYYLTEVIHELEDDYYAYFTTGYRDSLNDPPALDIKSFISATNDGVMTLETGN